MILHNSIRVAQNLSRRNSHAQIKLGDMPSLNNRVRLTYGHRNPLNHLNYREMRELASNEHEKYSGSWQNNVKRGSEVPTNNVESCEDNQPSLRGEAQRLCGSLRPAQNLQVTKSHSQNNPSLRGAVHSITESNPVQPFGSMPRCCSSLRIIRLIQAASDSSPSNCWACSMSSLSSGSSLNWNGGLPRLSFLCVDTSITPGVLCLCVMTHYTHKQQIATPRAVGAATRRLTNNVNRSNAMAKPQCNQTHPKNRVFIFLALNRADMHSRPHREVITAVSEREARKLLVDRFILVFAGCLPAKEIYHG